MAGDKQLGYLLLHWLRLHCSIGGGEGVQIVSLNSVELSAIESAPLTIAGIQPRLADYCCDFTNLIGCQGHVNIVGILSEKEEPSVTSKGRHKLGLTLRDAQHMEVAVTAVGGNACDLEEFDKDSKVIIFGAQRR